jgi:methyltransferase (TIGR00027 family)
VTDTTPLERQASGTALATAFMRAMAAHDPRKEVRGEDYLAECFLEEEQKKPLQDVSVRNWVMANKMAAGAYEFMLARTAFFDQIVERALKANIGQAVWLGAGYDSRPYRFRDSLQDTRIFELDAAPTQERKRACLRQAGISMPEPVCFVPMNLETQDLRESLIAAGYSRAKKTLFIWEGVTYYLGAGAVDATLAFVRSNAPAGSSICFDYAALSDEALKADNVTGLRQHLRSHYADEPGRFGIRVGEINAFLAERGFEVAVHLTAAEMTQRYLPTGSDAKVGQVPALFSLVHAAVAPINRITST